MDVESFRKNAGVTIDFICNYYKTLADRKVYPSIKPGYLQELLPSSAPESPDSWSNIMRDTEDHIMSGITHWQHPQFFAYFPHGASFPSLMADMVSDAIGVVPFSWTASPACSELEVVVMDWLCKALGLPEHFLSKSNGGGVIQTSASEAIYNCIIAARAIGIEKVRGDDKTSHDSDFLPQLVAYCSEESHSCVEKGLKLALLKIRILPTDENYSLRGETVERTFKEDISNGLTPIFFSSIFGSTSSTAYDRFDEIGPICKKYGVWYHIDGAYAGFSLICPEMRKYVKGIEYADSFNANANKWFLVHSYCACLWVKDKNKYCSSFIIDPLYLETNHTNLTYDFRHWGIPLTRRFRSLKLWYMLRTYGLEKIRNYQRNHIKLAKKFEELLVNDGNYEICNQVHFGLVCFRLAKSTEKMNQEFLTELNNTKEIHMIPTELRGKYVIRFCIVRENAQESDIDEAFSKIQVIAKKIRKAGDPCHCTNIKKGTKEEEEERVEERGRMSFTVEVPLDVFNKLKEKTKLKDMVQFMVAAKREDGGPTSLSLPAQITKR